ncbi:SOS response-associated peptidase [Halomonas cupida]|uniref:SOS response-associated peptidase n=1 Tax=Halomonas cupida TaxID=44933 RepID=UPI003A93743C
MINQFAADLRNIPSSLSQLDGAEEFQGKARFNVCSGQDVPGIYTNDSGKPCWSAFRWGYHPHYAHGGQVLINAKIEEVASDSFFRGALSGRRCIIPASGWYESHGVPPDPYYVSRSDGSLLLIGGVWVENNVGKMTMAMLSEPSRPDAGNLKDRMPLCLSEDCINAWLSPELADRDELRKEIKRIDVTLLTNWQVSNRVLSMSYDDAGLIERV